MDTQKSPGVSVEDEAFEAYSDSASCTACNDREDLIAYEGFKAGYAAAQARADEELERLRKVDRFYRELCHQWTETCDDNCDKWGHSEACQMVDLGNAKRALTDKLARAEAMIARLESALEDYRYIQGAFHNGITHYSVAAEALAALKAYREGTA